VTRVVRFPLWAVPAAIGVNVLLFGTAAFLLQERALPQDVTDPIAVSLVKLDAPSLPEQDPMKEPEKPQPKERLDFMPDVVRPDLGALGEFDIGVAVNLGGASGISGTREFVFEAYELDQAPQPIIRVPPPYPYGARERGIEGAVQIKMLVTTEGTVGEVRILEARPEGIFEESVRRTVPQWKFAPGKIQGKAVTAWVVTTVHFRLG
jgi:protein TonB